MLLKDTDNVIPLFEFLVGDGRHLFSPVAATVIRFNSVDIVHVKEIDALKMKYVYNYAADEKVNCLLGF